MIQSLQGRIDEIQPDVFDVVVVDEFHHAAADSYDRLLHHLEPRELLGLTATPQRLDGRDVTGWFDNRIAIELRWQGGEDRDVVQKASGLHQLVASSAAPSRQTT